MNNKSFLKKINKPADEGRISNFKPINEEKKHQKAVEFKQLCDVSDRIANGEKSILPNGYEIIDNAYDSQTNFKAVTYQKGNEIVICYVGTDFRFKNVLKGDFSSVKDSAANVKMLKSRPTRQMEKANEYFRKNKKDYNDQNINFTVIGHSEGGSEALYVSTQNNTRAYTFNAYGLHRNLYDKNTDYTNQITNYRTSNDPVSKLRAPRGETYILETEQTFKDNFKLQSLKERHQISPMGEQGKTAPFTEAVPLENYRQNNRFFINNLSRVAANNEQSTLFNRPV